MLALNAIILLAVSLAIGSLIGLERGWAKRAGPEGTRIAGIRTFGLIGLVGGFAGLFSIDGEPFLLGFSAFSIAVILIAAHGISLWVQQSGKADATREVGITSVVAGLLTFVLGAAATSGYLFEAAATGVIATILLSAKAEIHSWIQALTPIEIRAALKLLLMSVVVLPILPNRSFGPWQALNPYEIWWMVVLIALISFSGYFAMRIAGPNTGALLTGLFSGLASSTVLTMHFSRASRKSPKSATTLAPAILVACATMPARMLLVVAVVNMRMLEAIILPCLSMAAVLGLAAWWQWHAKEKRAVAADEPVLSNPLELRPAFLFGGFLALIVLASEGIKSHFGHPGLIVVSAVSGLADVDAVTLAMSRLATAPDIIGPAGFAVIVAASVNSLVKGGLSVSLGGKVMIRFVALPLGLAALIGLAIAWLTTGTASPLHPMAAIQ